MKTAKELPYDFDLHFDVKTIEQLRLKKRELLIAIDDLAYLRDLCDTWDVDFDSCEKIESIK